MLGALRGSRELVTPEIEAFLEVALDLLVIEHAKESENASTAEHATIKVLGINRELSHNKALGFLLAA